MKIKIGSVDMYGALGRDLHPHESDKGLIGVVEKYETEEWPCGSNEEATYEIGIFTIKLEDGRRLEIMSYEVAELVWENK